MELANHLRFCILPILLVCANVHSEIFRCKRLANCSCWREQSGYYYECPPDNPIVNLKIEINSEYSKASFEYYNQSQWDYNLLPKLELGNVDYFFFKRCPVPKNFKTIMDKLGIKSVSSFRFDDSVSEINGPLRISRSFFEGLNDIQDLRLNNNNITIIDEDAFVDMHNLLQLDLESNSIQLSPNLFKNLGRLRWLDLSENHIKELPKGIFDNLKNLTVLQMWYNDLTSIDGSVFENLGNLKSLSLRLNKLKHLDQEMLSHLTNLLDIDFMNNKLEHIPENFFINNKRLKTVIITYNKNLTVLPDKLFSDLNDLEKVNLNGNGLVTLPDNLFQNSSNITTIMLKENQLEQLPEGIFHGLKGLETLDLEDNKLQELPVKIFEDLKKLKDLNLGYNQLSNISAETFSSLSQLRKLNLQNNNLSKITEETFYYLDSLEELNLEMNNIHTIEFNSFHKNTELKIINVRHNQLSFEQFENIRVSPFNPCLKLEELYLDNNHIRIFFEDWVQTKIYLKKINASHNNMNYIEYSSLQKVSQDTLVIDLRHNNISRVDLQSLEPIALANGNLDASSYSNDYTILYLSGNPIKCDCFAFDLIRYFEGTMDSTARALVQIVDNLMCASPPIYAGLSVASLKSSVLTCSLDSLLDNSTCPRSCECSWRKFDRALIYDCSYRRISTIPEIILPEGNFFTQTEVHLEGNELREAPREGMGYENVTKLFLSENEISAIDWLPSKIKLLELDHNNISSLDYRILSQLNSSSVTKISLDHNPWKCDCSAANLTNFLREKQVNPSNITCSGTNKLLINLNRKNLCPTNLPIILGLSITLLVFFLIVAVSVALYYRYQQEIKVWLYAHNICLWFVTEEEIDREKLYDAFISYSHKDEDFVVNELVPVLEDGPHPYKLCLHYRDFIPGEFIARQITSSVEASRRTVVVLSESFLESVWGRMEFRTAHTQAMSEGRARVIIILYGDIDPNSVDDELQAYLKTNTYLKWGDPWFWDKLRYALPHSHKMLKKKSQRNNNIILTINDKLDLISAPTTPNVGSTPPAVSLDPLLIKGNPLDFTKIRIPNSRPVSESCTV